MTAKYSVIVVEDEEVIGKNVEKKINSLEGAFFVRKLCKNGRDALREMEKSPVDVVVTDIKMPVMDGLQLIRELKEKYATVKVVILSGYNDFEYAKEALIYQVKDYLLKPVEMEELKKTLGRVQAELDGDYQTFTGSFSHPSPEQMTERIKSFILNNYRKELNLLSIAKSMGYSPEHLSRVFKKQSGQSVVKYITMLRINEAKKMLLSDANLDVGLIGQSVGYSDALYFSRVFQKSTGVSPSEFRKGTRK